MAATQGHTQSLHTNALDEALALPTDFSARIARNTQLFLQQESGTTRIIDPWGGSFYVERLTAELATQGLGPHPGGRGAGRHGQGDRGRHPQAAHRGSRRHDPGAHRLRPAVGDRRQQVPPPKTKPPIDVLKVDNSAVRQLQIDKLARLKRERDPKAVARGARRAHPHRRRRQRQPAGARRRRRPRQGDGRRDFARRWRRSSAATAPRSRRSPASTSGRSAPCPTPSTRVRQLVAAFEANEGRRPRILVAKIGQDGHDRGQKVIASAFADLGFDVDIGPLFATPAEAARQAVENDVHIVGVSSLAAGHLTLVPELKAALAKRGPRRHHDRGRRRRPAAGLRRAQARRRRGDLPARHGDRGGRRGAGEDAQRRLGHAREAAE